MSKGSKRRPRFIEPQQLEFNWDNTFNKNKEIDAWLVQNATLIQPDDGYIHNVTNE